MFKMASNKLSKQLGERPNIYIVGAAEHSTQQIFNIVSFFFVIVVLMGVKGEGALKCPSFARCTPLRLVKTLMVWSDCWDIVRKLPHNNSPLHTSHCNFTWYVKIHYKTQDCLEKSIKVRHSFLTYLCLLQKFWDIYKYCFYYCSSIITVGVLEFAGVIFFFSVSNRIFNMPTGHPKDLPVNQRQSWYRAPK